MRSTRTTLGLVTALALAWALALTGPSGAEGFAAPPGQPNAAGRGVGQTGRGAQPPESAPGDGSAVAPTQARGARMDPSLVGAAGLVTGGVAIALQDGSDSTTYIVNSANVPELDPALAGGAVVLLAGGALLLRARRRRS
jgi:hypothetical protein